MSKSDSDIKTQLNKETSKIPWHELQRFYAAGMVVVVDPSMDLLKVASEFSADNKQAVAAWLQDETVARVTDQQASHWYDDNPSLWAVVIAPWVLVQVVQEDK
jgi:hypothetical protein